MPLHDGTGPWGRGAGTGRGKGGCYTRVGYNRVIHSGFSKKHGWLLGIMVPVGTAILRDLLNPSGVLRRIVHASLDKRIADDSKKIVRKAECTVMNGNAVPVEQKKSSDK
jgi:hypothetical protein